MENCRRKTLCVDCTKYCPKAGKAENDCQKVTCTNSKKYDCENCGYLKRHNAKRRRYFDYKRTQYEALEREAGAAETDEREA